MMARPEWWPRQVPYPQPSPLAMYYKMRKPTGPGSYSHDLGLVRKAEANFKKMANVVTLTRSGALPRSPRPVAAPTSAYVPPPPSTPATLAPSAPPPSGSTGGLAPQYAPPPSQHQVTAEAVSFQPLPMQDFVDDGPAVAGSPTVGGDESSAVGPIVLGIVALGAVLLFARGK